MLFTLTYIHHSVVISSEHIWSTIDTKETISKMELLSHFVLMYLGYGMFSQLKVHSFQAKVDNSITLEF